MKLFVVKRRSKYYTSLMRGKFETRDRLQVTGTDFQDVSYNPFSSLQFILFFLHSRNVVALMNIPTDS